MRQYANVPLSHWHIIFKPLQLFTGNRYDRAMTGMEVH